jgi:hypothetical protein
MTNFDQARQRARDVRRSREAAARDRRLVKRVAEPVDPPALHLRAVVRAAADPEPVSSNHSDRLPVLL